jgi:dihydrofolate synthase/folylpolyglutamate synthase
MKRPGRSYDSALKYLFAQTDYEQMLRVRYNRDTFSLDRMKALTKALGEPQFKYRTVHVAGTKGKGSTCTMLAHMLRACGFKVGLYTSPHITDVRERIQINGEMISQAALTRLICQAEPIIERMASDKPTFFEIFTALAFQHFADEQVDVAVIETGLGGRLDSTNVMKPAVCGLTSISMDHMQQLGATLAKIAAEKGGILKANIPAISVPQAPEAKRVLKKIAKETQTPLMFTGDDIEFSYRVESSRTAGCHTRICLTTPRSRFEHLPVPLLGEHQALNCGLALALLDVLSGMDELKICTGYRLDGRPVEDFDPAIMGRVECVYEALPSWREEIAGSAAFGDLPQAAQAYVRRVEELTGRPVGLIGVGPGREATIIHNTKVHGLR